MWQIVENVFCLIGYVLIFLVFVAIIVFPFIKEKYPEIFLVKKEDDYVIFGAPGHDGFDEIIPVENHEK